jgi:crotonobetainyl-CoA:carnitine CoA-transferase CaiB-like acyl-CoA transferase
MDHYAALASVFASLLALIERNRSGRGQAVASSLLGGAMLTMAEAVVGPDGLLTGIAHLDHEQMGVSPAHRLYRTAEGMIAVAALDPHEAEALGRLAGDNPAAFFSALASADAKKRLDEAGVPAEIVALAQMDDFLDSADNDAAGLHARYDHRDYGALRQIGGFWNLGDLPLALDRPAPALGEHSREILRMIGLEDRFEALAAAGLAA